MTDEVFIKTYATSGYTSSVAFRRQLPLRGEALQSTAVSKTVGAGIFSQIAVFSNDGVQRYSEFEKIVRCGKITSR